jgi:hypothetical protein
LEIMDVVEKISETDKWLEKHGLLSAAHPLR